MKDRRGIAAVFVLAAGLGILFAASLWGGPSSLPISAVQNAPPGMPSAAVFRASQSNASAVVEARSPGSAHQSTVQAQISDNQLVIRGENWGRYPGSLDDQVNRALEDANPEMAHFLGNRLADCVTYVSVREALNINNVGVGTGPSPEDQRMRSLCQSVSGDWQEVSWRLLSLAVKGNQPGAAADMFRTAGRLSAQGSRQLVTDAQLGHLWSVITLAAVPAATLGVARDEHFMAQQALAAASRRVDAETSDRWMGAAQSIAARWGQRPEIFNTAPISDAASARAEAMARNLVENAKR